MSAAIPRSWQGGNIAVDTDCEVSQMQRALERDVRAKNARAPALPLLWMR